MEQRTSLNLACDETKTKSVKLRCSAWRTGGKKIARSSSDTRSVILRCSVWRCLRRVFAGPHGLRVSDAVSVARGRDPEIYVSGEESRG